ncbi:MAG: hypothetical protein SGILL_005593 [Bacillariaceae sp.]
MKFTIASSTLVLSSLLTSSATAKSLRGGKSSRHLTSNDPASADASNPYLLPFTGDCELGQGFDIQTGCKSTAINPSTMKKQTSNINPESTTYTSTLATSEDVTTMMSSVTSAEGSYSPDTFSAKASTTVSYLTSSDVSTNTITFYIGETQVMKKDQITDVNEMALSDDAFNTFKTNPQHFIDAYGPHFISYFYSGATFAGSLSLWEQTSAYSETLSIFASMSASDLFFSASASEDYTNSYSEYQASLSSQCTATYSGMDKVLQYNVSSPLDLGDAYNAWAKDVSVDSVAPITMLYVDYAEIPQVANYIANLNGTKYGTYTNLFSPPKISSDTTSSISNEAIQTSNLVTALEQAKNYNCYVNSESEGFSTELEQQLVLASDHLSFINDQMNETDIIQVQEQGITSPFYQAAAMQKNYTDLLIKFPGCVPVCPKNTQWTQPTDNHNCNSAPPSEFMCAGTNEPLNGIAFSHSCNDNAAWQENISVECMNPSTLHATLYTGKTYATPMVQNWDKEPQYTTQMCPTGYYITSVNFHHSCGDNGTDDRSYQLVCAEINKSVGYELGAAAASEWVSKVNCHAQNIYQCPVGSIMVGL